MRLDIDGRPVVLRRATVPEILALRHAELRHGLPRASAEFEGDLAPTTHHYGGFAGDATVACASFMAAPRDGAPAFQLRGMATRADLARRGVGGALLRLAVREIEDAEGVAFFWCNARLPAVPFYRRLGWRIVSEPFDIPTAGPHRVMTFRADAGG